MIKFSKPKIVEYLFLKNLAYTGEWRNVKIKINYPFRKSWGIYII